MILDGILLILCIIAFIRGWKKGLLWAIVSIIAVLIGIVISLKCAHLLADYLFENNLKRNFAVNPYQVYNFSFIDDKHPSKWKTELYYPVYPKVVASQAIPKPKPQVVVQNQ